MRFLVKAAAVTNDKRRATNRAWDGGRHCGALPEAVMRDMEPVMRSLADRLHQMAGLGRGALGSMPSLPLESWMEGPLSAGQRPSHHRQWW